MKSSASVSQRGEMGRLQQIVTEVDAMVRVSERAVTRTPSWILVGAVLLLHVALAAAVVDRGFLEYNADGYTRIIRGHEWLLAPRWEVGVWLPLQTWIFGAGLYGYDSLAVTPRVINLLLSLVTCANLFLIGRAISGKVAGLIAAAVGAVFPWMVWFAVSGMSEPLFHAALTTGVAGFMFWNMTGRDRYLLIGSIGIALSTMVRYEGWFYAAAFATLVLGLSAKRGSLNVRVVTLVALPMLFPLIWIEQYWYLYGDPLGFARETASIKEELQPENATADLLQRVAAFPRETYRLAPWLALSCAIGAGYALYRRVTWWPLIALVAGQAALLVAVSAGFSNLGPGAERYLLSILILLFPVLGAAVMLVPRPTTRALAVLAVAIVVYRLTPTLLDPPVAYPGDDVRQAAERSGRVLDELENQRAALLLPPAPADAFNAGYAFRILSGYPDAWIITSDPALFQQLVRDCVVGMWAIDSGVDTPPPDAEDIIRSGRFLIGVREPVKGYAVARP